MDLAEDILLLEFKLEDMVFSRSFFLDIDSSHFPFHLRIWLSDSYSSFMYFCLL